ncbi:Hpt domain-containing protein [Silicimonas algicola]|uniref:Signal transduction histidine kinase-like protein n=1 Tax=Silicimonas algicola TaxID=1826607 RepID=A0A316GRS6_9RHOB|nr:Hpt domain-containing protein [Silicimonas algicola]PWK57727.1 signal transduction histidine kinase-like protein [Silicimonas algicola]
MSDPMQEIMASFFVECEELHEALVDALQTMADGESDVETINVAFRAVHSIKGGAGAFGLNELVEFAHQFETVMDACRSGALVPDDALHALFLRCADMLSDLIRCSRDGEEIDSGTSAALIAELSGYAGGPGHDEPAPVIDFQPMTLDLLDLGGGLDVLPDLPLLDAIEPDPAAVGVTVEFRPEGELYESGNEPLFLLKTLADLGPCEIDCAFAPPETIQDLDRPGGRLTWTIRIGGDATPAAVQEVFEFAEGLCHLKVMSSGGPALPVLERTLDDMEDDDDEALAAPPPLAQIPAAREARSEPRAAAPQPKTSPTVRVDLDRIERLVNLVGELVINQAMLSQSIAEQNIAPNSPVSAGLDEFMQLTRNI